MKDTLTKIYTNGLVEELDKKEIGELIDKLKDKYTKRYNIYSKILDDCRLEMEKAQINQEKGEKNV